MSLSFGLAWINLKKERNGIITCLQDDKWLVQKKKILRLNLY